MVILRFLLALALSSFALYAQISQTDCDPWKARPREDNAITTFSLSGPLQFSSGLTRDRATGFTRENEFLLKTFSAPQPHLVAAARFNLDSAALPPPATQASTVQTTTKRPKAVSYSNGYMLRSKIHKYASIATLPLFAAEAVVGQKLYSESDSDSWKSVHSGLAYGIVGLFGANTVTGIWNLWEGRKDPNGRGKRLFHSILMLSASAGFVATAALAPDDDDENRNGSPGNRRSTHRNVAIGSMGVAAVGYIYMLLAK